MKKVFITLLFIPILISAQNRKKPKVLFIGNSYIYVNNLPLMVYNMAIASGDSLTHDCSCPGAYTFFNHYNDPNTIAKISAGGWDYVVLQAQSQEPSKAPWQVNSQTLPYAIKLDSLVKVYNPCAVTVFYETWGRKFGDVNNCPNYPPVCTYIGMQNRLRDSYKMFADTVQAVMAPVGEAFRKSIALTPTLDLYQSDNSHPVIEGTYLAAAVFYEILFQKSIISNSYNPGVSATTRTFLQQVASTTVRDSLPVWNIGTNLLWANYTFTATSANYQFFSKSQNYVEKWYFGDGSTSTLSAPTHTYASSGFYTISHVVKDSCKKDSVSNLISVVKTATTTTTTTTTVGIDSYNRDVKAVIIPNPGHDNIKVYLPAEPANGAKIEVIDITGKIVYKAQYTQTLNLSSLQNGLYFIRIHSGANEFRARFVKIE